jgi:hypothetical protein
MSQKSFDVRPQAITVVTFVKAMAPAGLLPI